MQNAQTTEERDPWAFTQGDYMKRALKFAGLSRDEMAEYLGVAPATVSTWMNDRIAPSRQTLRLWALRTGVPYEWLVHPPGLEPGTHCFRHGRLACWACDGAEEPYPKAGPLAIVTAMPTRGIASSPQWGDAA